MVASAARESASWLRLAPAYLDLGKSYVELAMEAVVRPFFLVNSAVQTIHRWLDAIATFAKGGDR